MVSRRALLVTGGAGVVVLGVGASVLHSDLRKARRPWEAAGEGFGDPRLDALSYAILAPNPHNMQPWRVALEGEDALTLYCDLTRLLPETDPPNRQIVIGLGAFLELLRQAALQSGWRTEVTPFPEGEPQPVLDERPIAHVRFLRAEAAAPDPLFGVALDRRTVRAVFDETRPVAGDALSAVGAAAALDEARYKWTTTPGDIAALKRICTQGWRVEMATEATHKESTRLMRIGEKQINENPDGISLSGPLMEALRLSGAFAPARMNDPNSTAYEEMLKFYNGLIDTSMAFGWLITPDNSRKEQLAAGADWVRLHLAATQAGLALHPLSQALQEFPSMSELFKEIHEVVGVETPARLQGLMRFGYAKFPPPAPRWPVESIMIADG